MAQSIAQAVNLALDKAYLESALPMLEQIGKISNGAEMQTALMELEAEAERLLAEDKRLEPNNPSLLKALLVYGTVLVAVQALIAANSGSIEDTGIQLAAPSITAKIFAALSGRADPLASLGAYKTFLASLGIDWKTDAGAVAIRYTQTPAWISRMEGWGQGYADLARKTIVTGIQNGWGPRQVATTMRQQAQNIPQWAATNLTRTLQLTSYRDAVLALEIENSQFLLGKYRIEQLDNRTCAACVALHGTRLAIGERIEGHYNCRGTESYILPGREQPEFMVADGNVVPFMTGEEWYRGLSPTRQQSQNFVARSPAMYNAYKAGVPLSQFVGHYHDDVFGDQIIQQSLIGALGESAKQFYVK